MAVSEAQKRAKRKYEDKTYKRISLLIRNDKAERLKAYTESHGESVNGLINRLIDQEINPGEDGEDQSSEDTTTQN